MKCIDCKHYLIDVNGVSVCTLSKDKPIGNTDKPNWCPLESDDIRDLSCEDMQDVLYTISEELINIAPLIIGESEDGE